MARAKAKTDDGRETLARMGRLETLVGRHQAEADRRVSLRQTIEEEWHKDLLQFHSRYDDDVLKGITEVGGSKLFVPMTRPKCNAMAARIMDVQFPADEKNWSIEPTPVPEMANGGIGHNGGPALNDPMQMPQGPGQPLQAEQGAPVAMPGMAGADPAAAGAPAPQPEDPAEVACRLMEKEMEDQLVECDFAMHSRDAIDVACKIGPGIIEGPIVNEQTRRGWAQGEDGAYQLQYHEDPRPAFYWVDPWSFFPDPLARNILESEENYVRYLWTKRDMRKFAKRPDANVDAIRLIISAEPDTNTPQYLSRLQALTGSQADVVQKFYHVWKVSGPLSGDDMRDLAMAFGDEKTQKLMDDVDPLEEVQAVLWFCQGHVLKFGIGALDSGECNYSIFNLEKDEASIWGYGVGRMIRDPQKGLNAAFRMVIDNAALATGDQIIINQSILEPKDGDWKQRARKTWMVTEAAAHTQLDLSTAFANWSTECHVEELSAIMNLCYRQIDDATGMPTANEQQDPGTIPANTPVGTAILRTVAQNVIFKRIIKNWDDDITVPCLRRLYDWNMQFNPKEEIKGDYNIKPRGASTLLVREMQNQNLALVANMLGQSPVYGKYIKGVEVCRELILSLSLDPEKLIVSDEEADAADAAEQAAMQAQAQGPAGPDPAIEQAKIDQKREEVEQNAAVKNAENATRKYIADRAAEVKLKELAAMLNVSEDKLQADLLAHREKIQQQDRSIAAEMAVRASEQEHLNDTEIANS